MARVTQADVLRAALAHFKSRKGGFTRDAYFSNDEEAPGQHAGATCAIGGVEQAIWKLTGQTISEEHRESLGQEQGYPSKEDRFSLYGGVMRKLNAEARKRFPVDEDGDEIRTLEEVTMMGTPKVAKKRTLEVFETVLAGVDRRS